MLAVAKKPRIEVRAEVIPETLIDFLDSNFGGVELESSGDSVRPEDIPELAEAREDTSPGEAVFINRDMRGWTQARLARKLGIAPSVVSDIENGRRAVSRKMAAKLGDAFGTDPAAFFSFD